ncbi:hypothetical protein V7654_08215 [Bacillus sp. JJ1609]|uniref:nucleotidyltransferase domain-containing protein n=1 Tax=Bacillus sp. JJ1609 TaxID=3122977 RepID=UPI002FFE5E56
MSNFESSWFIAGGWALDLYFGKETREHSDIEIAIFRQDQFHLKDYLKGWDFKKVVSHKMIQWKDEFLSLPVHEIHASNRDSGEKLEILLNESIEREWIFRRDGRIKLPHSSAWCYSKSGIPILNPAIVLLYKAKNTSEKDNHDFMIIKDFLTVNQKMWLRNAVHLQNSKHAWLEYLE